jgi:hypothetical protein
VGARRGFTRAEVGQLRKKVGRHGKGCADCGDGFSSDAAAEFNDWYDTEHICEREPGFLTLQRWIGSD